MISSAAWGGKLTGTPISTWQQLQGAVPIESNHLPPVGCGHVSQLLRTEMRHMELRITELGMRHMRLQMK